METPMSPKITFKHREHVKLFSKNQDSIQFYIDQDLEILKDRSKERR